MAGKKERGWSIGTGVNVEMRLQATRKMHIALLKILATVENELFQMVLKSQAWQRERSHRKSLSWSITTIDRSIKLN